jgi:hypothetical protein
VPRARFDRVQVLRHHRHHAIAARLFADALRHRHRGRARGLVASVAAGYYPARKAAHAHPVDIIRGAT